MKTIYSNIWKKPLSAKGRNILMGVLFFIAGVFYVIAIFVSQIDEMYGYLFLIGYPLFLYPAIWIGLGFAFHCIVDDETRTITVPFYQGRPMKIDNIETVTKHRKKNGKLRKVNIHEFGARYVNVHINNRVADQFVAKLKEINPYIIVKTVNYN